MCRERNLTERTKGIHQRKHFYRTEETIKKTCTESNVCKKIRSNNRKKDQKNEYADFAMHPIGTLTTVAQPEKQHAKTTKRYLPKTCRFENRKQEQIM